MTEEAFVQQMQAYMPLEACEIGYKWLQKSPVRIKIARPRRSKLGDYRVKGKGQIPSISINGNLNPFSFAITFAHEVAHHYDFIERKTLQNAHGVSWKKIYSDLLHELTLAGVFPNDLIPAITKHIANPKAASCSDHVLLEELRAYDLHKPTLLKELPINAEFKIASNNRLFRKGPLKRTRYLCIELSSQRKFMIHGQCEVTLVESLT